MLSIFFVEKLEPLVDKCTLMWESILAIMYSVGISETDALKYIIDVTLFLRV